MSLLTNARLAHFKAAFAAEYIKLQNDRLSTMTPEERARFQSWIINGRSLKRKA